MTDEETETYQNQKISNSCQYVCNIFSFANNSRVFQLQLLQIIQLEKIHPRHTAQLFNSPLFSLLLPPTAIINNNLNCTTIFIVTKKEWSLVGLFKNIDFLTSQLSSCCISLGQKIKTE